MMTDYSKWIIDEVKWAFDFNHCIMTLTHPYYAFQKKKVGDAYVFLEIDRTDLNRIRIIKNGINTSPDKAFIHCSYSNSIFYFFPNKNQIIQIANGLKLLPKKLSQQKKGNVEYVTIFGAFFPDIDMPFPRDTYYWIKDLSFRHMASLTVIGIILAILSIIIGLSK